MCRTGEFFAFCAVAIRYEMSHAANKPLTYAFEGVFNQDVGYVTVRVMASGSIPPFTAGSFSCSSIRPFFFFQKKKNPSLWRT